MKNWIVLGKWMLVLSSVAACQPKEQPGSGEIKRRLPISKEASRIDHLNQQSHANTLKDNKDSAVYYASEALNGANAIHYSYGLARAYCNLARIAKHFDDDFAGAESLAFKSLYWYGQSTKQDGIDSLYDELGFALLSQSKYAEAEKFAWKQYEWCSRHRDQQGMWNALNSVGVIFSQEGKYDSALNYFLPVYEQVQVAHNSKWAMMNLFLLGGIYRAVGDYSAALDYYRRAFQMDNSRQTAWRQSSDVDFWVKMEFAELFSLNNKMDSASYYYDLFKPAKNDVYYRVYLISTGEFYLLHQAYQAALNNFVKGLEMHRKHNDQNEIKRSLLDVARAHLALKNYKRAIRSAREGLALAEQSGSRQFIRDAYEILAIAFDRLALIDSAYIYQQRYTSLREAVANDQVRGRLAFFQYAYQIQLLHKEKQIEHAELQSALQGKRFLLVIVLFLALVGIVIVRNSTLQRKNEVHRRHFVEQEMHVQKMQAERSEAALQTQALALEMQALRAQMNPHFIFNCLNSINHFILKSNITEASQYLVKFSRLVRLILQHSRESLISLEDELEAFRLYLDLEALRCGHRFEYSINVQESLELSALQVPPLLIQPFAENAVWHGLMGKDAKGHLEIAILRFEEGLCIQIKDDGIGRKHTSGENDQLPHTSMGMQITSRRIAMMQRSSGFRDDPVAIVDLITDEGQPAGTEILIKIPAIYD